MSVSHWSDCRAAPWLISNSWRHIRQVTLRLVNWILFLSLENGARWKIFKFRLKYRTVRLATVSCSCSLPQHPPCKQEFNRTLWNPQFEISALLEYYAAYGGNSLPTFRDNRLVQTWRIKKSKILGFLDSWIFLPLKMAPTSCPETSVKNYNHTLRNMQEECKSHLLHGGILKSRKPKCSLCAH